MTFDQMDLFGDAETPLKPPYSIPWLREIERRPKNGLVAIGTFSGSGGSSLGMKMAGFTVPAAMEFTPQGAATYRANNPLANVVQQDVREVSGAMLLEAASASLGREIRPGELDLFEGSPPCSSFSNAGVRSGAQYEDRVGKVKVYSEGIKQRTDDLFEEWVRLVREINPKMLLAENVPEMARPGSAQKYLHMIQGMLHDLGYDTHARVYSSQNVGCATMRKRLVLLGVRRDVGAVPIPKLTGSGYTLREGLETLPVPIPEDEMEWASFNRPANLAAEEAEGEEGGDGIYQLERHWGCLKPGQGHDPFLCINPDPDGKKPHLFSLIKASWDKPLYTITASGSHKGAANVVHPDERRKFTATEIKWLSGFPADYVLTGTPQNRYERLGRAVTPPLYEALAGHLAKVLL